MDLKMLSNVSTVWWPNLCGGTKYENGSEFWILDLSYNSSLPDLPRCFQNSVLVWIPCIFLWLCSFVWIPYLFSKHTKHNKRSVLNIVKLVLSVMLLVIYLGNLVRCAVASCTPDALSKYILQSLTMALIVFLLNYEYRKSIISSGVLSLSWLLFVLFYLVEFRSRVIRGATGDMFQHVTFFISYILIVTQFIACFFSDQFPSSRTRHPASEELMSNHSLKVEKEKPCPEEKAPFFSKITFFWITKLMVTGYKRMLNFDDLWNLRHSDRSDEVVPKFEKLWQEEINKSYNISNHSSLLYDIDGTGSVKVTMNGNETSPTELNEKSSKYNNNNINNKDELIEQASEMNKNVSLWRVIVKTCGWYYASGGLFKLIYDILGFIQPILLSFLITFIKTAEFPLWLGILVVVCMFLVSFLRTLILQQYWHICYVVGQQLRTAIVGIVYRKALRLSATARKSTTVGEIVNLMSVDAQKFNDAPAFIHMLWSTPVIVALCIYMLWQVLGPPVLAGLLCMLVMIPINAFVATKNKKLQVQQMNYKDSRIKMITEILNGIKVLKLYSWEEYFKKNILHVRDKEIKVLKYSQYLSAVSAISWFMTPYFVALTTFATYVLSSPDHILDANKAFVSLSLFNMLNYPLSILPMVITIIVQSSVSVNRLKRFLLESELSKYVIEDHEMKDNSIDIKDGYFAWGKTDDFVLKNVNLAIPSGKLVAVVGQVGSGKSSLVSAICGEMDVAKGVIKTKGSVAYVPQQAWIQNATIRDNILFSRPYSSTKYKNIIEACSLPPDFLMLPASDQTEVGEKGINLSGGQKQRLSLARALYQEADIYLLDDPLSAVDTHVGRHIFDHVVGPSGLLKKKTRVLITNQLTYLPQVDLIVVLKDGVISEMGSYSELLSHQGPFADFIQNYVSEREQQEASNIEPVVSQVSIDEVQSPLKKRQISRQTSLLSQKSSTEEKEKDGAKLVAEEMALSGNVKLSVFKRYIMACRVVFVLCLFLFYIFYISSQISSNIWLSMWSNDPPTNETSTRDLRLGVYGGLGIAQAIGVVGMSLSIATSCTSGSKNLHAALLHSVLRAPMSFFDTTPLGRIVNRFSRDVDTIDISIPMSLRIWLATLAGVFSTFFVISYATPIFIVAIVPLALFYYFIQRFYINSSRQLRRIDSNYRSPIYAHFGETVVGCSSIRAYRQEFRFISSSNNLVDRSQMTNYPIIVSNRWLGVWLEFLGTIIVLLSGLFAVLQKDSIDAGLAGLSLSYSLQVTVTLNMFVRMTSDLETNIVSVERIDEYIQCPKEAPSHTDVSFTPSWPSTGQVEFNDFSVRYRDNLDLVLKNFSCTFSPGEKVGIVGRTGAGKSSLALALFRIIEAASGSINIDDVTISSLGLHDLRSRLTIIPQDPVLFSGTLRMNLDPSGEKSDEELWTAVKHAHLHKFVSSLPDQLMSVCSEGGENLSVGQRQLVCLARALLRKSSILIMDEATAAVDLETDDLIQKTIRSEFDQCTVITIAHRLNTIIDYNRILVLDGGKLSEFDSPEALLADTSSEFYKMAKNANLVE